MRLKKWERPCLKRPGVLPTNEVDMKKTVLGSAIALAWCVAAPFAQQQPAPTPKAAPAHNVFVLTGCLKAGANATATFKLTDASSIGQPTPAEAGEAGAVGTSGRKASYELRPVSGVDAQGMDADALKAHLGQRIEVIVRPVDSPAPARTDGLVGVRAAKPIEPAAERFSVTSIKRVIDTCS
jgi:hypothetical protein